MSHVCLTHYEMLEKHIAKLEADRDRLAAELAEARKHSDWQAEKIASLQDKVDGFAGVYAELEEAQRQVEFWRATAERRGDELKAHYTEQSKAKEMAK